MSDLDQLIMDSNSNDIVKNIALNMDGKTFHHHYHILYDIRTLLGNKKKIYTEIGTYCGGSMSLMLQHNYDTEIHCIDPMVVENNQTHLFENNIKKFNLYNRNVILHKKFSNDIGFLNDLNKNSFKTDILFIDGDHSYSGVLQDFNNYEKFVNINGYIIFDDYLDYKHSPNVKKAVDYIVKNLDESKYEIIGSLRNHKDSFTNGGGDFLFLNEFIIKKI